MNKLLKILILIIMITGCSVSKDKVLLSLDKVKKIAYYRDGEIQDFTDYAKYNVSLEKMHNNKYFKKMNNELKEDFLEYINDYENFVSVFKDNYDFDKNIISNNDYIYIYDKPNYPKLGFYNIYYIDTETNILYYFHNNI